MATVTQLLNQSLGLLGVYAAGQTPRDEDTSLAKFHLERLVEELVDEEFAIPFETTDEFTLESGTAIYTIGESTADIDTVRPDLITKVYVTVGNTNYPIDIIPYKQYQEICLPSIRNRPRKLAYNPTVPNGTIFLYPVPNSTDTVTITSKKTFDTPMTTNLDLTSDYSVPPNYFAFLMYKLAKRLEPFYQVDPNIDALIKEGITETECKIKSKNAFRQLRQNPIPYFGVNDSVWSGNDYGGESVSYVSYSISVTLLDDQSQSTALANCYGLVQLRDLVHGVGALFRVANSFIFEINVDVNFSSTKDNDTTVNFYSEAGYYYLQNKTGMPVVITLTYYE